jgi:hypothetical protein
VSNTCFLGGRSGGHELIPATLVSAGGRLGTTGATTGATALGADADADVDVDVDTGARVGIAVAVARECGSAGEVVDAGRGGGDGKAVAAVPVGCDSASVGLGRSSGSTAVGE